MGDGPACPDGAQARSPCDAVPQPTGRSCTPTVNLPGEGAHTLDQGPQGPQGQHPPEAPSHIRALPGIGSSHSHGHCGGGNRTPGLFWNLGGPVGQADLGRGSKVGPTSSVHRDDVGKQGHQREGQEGGRPGPRVLVTPCDVQSGLHGPGVSSTHTVPALTPREGPMPGCVPGFSGYWGTPRPGHPGA